MKILLDFYSNIPQKNKYSFSDTFVEQDMRIYYFGFLNETCYKVSTINIGNYLNKGAKAFFGFEKNHTFLSIQSIDTILDKNTQGKLYLNSDKKLVYEDCSTIGSEIIANEIIYPDSNEKIELNNQKTTINFGEKLKLKDKFVSPFSLELSLNQIFNTASNLWENC